MKTIRMDSGIEILVDEKVGDDIELLDDMIATDEGDPLALSRLCTKLLGKEEKKKLYDSIREKDGRVPVTAVVPAIVEIITKLGRTEDDGKNS